MEKNLYSDSWEVYKAHSEHFNEDNDYYKALCLKKKTLELFAGYGRLTNKINGVCSALECVELEPNFAKYINLDRDKIHVCNVLDFSTKKTFERIIAGYNSFCLLTKDEDVHRFFQKISAWLEPGGIASLSYFHHGYWDNTYTDTFVYNDRNIFYSVDYDLTDIKNNKGVWIDKYRSEDGMFNTICKYPVRLYDQDKEINRFLNGTGLYLVEKIIDYDKPNISDPGWVEYVFKKES